MNTEDNFIIPPDWKGSADDYIASVCRGEQSSITRVIKVNEREIEAELLKVWEELKRPPAFLQVGPEAWHLVHGRKKVMWSIFRKDDCVAWVGRA